MVVVRSYDRLTIVLVLLYKYELLLTGFNALGFAVEVLNYIGVADFLGNLPIFYIYLFLFGLICVH